MGAHSDRQRRHQYRMDCPRAEVMISFRPAQDQTYIAQLLDAWCAPLGAAHPRQ